MAGLVIRGLESRFTFGGSRVLGSVLPIAGHQVTIISWYLFSMGPVWLGHLLVDERTICVG